MKKKTIKGSAKKQVRKVTKSIVKKQEKGVMAIIPYSEISKPEMYKGKFSLVPTPFNETQIKAIISPTPMSIIKSRPGKGGGNWDFVPGWWFKKKANFVFGFAHDFELESERVDGDFITVKGKVTVRDQKTGRIIAIKSDYGGKEIKYRKDKPHTEANYLDIANDFKAAATDCFKRCMVQFGFAMDVYGKSESISEGMVVTENKPEYKASPTVVRPVVKEAPKVEINTDDLLNKLKSRLFKLGARNEKEALQILAKKTGLIWKGLTNHGPEAIRGAYSKLLIK